MSIHKKYVVFLFLILPFLFGGSASSLEERSLNCEIDLADWSLEEISDVGFISVGIYHKETGDEMVVYHVRRKRPVIEQPSVPQSRIPPINEGVFLLDNFHQGNTNRLGGHFSIIIRAPSQSHVTIDEAPDGRRSLCFTYA